MEAKYSLLLSDADMVVRCGFLLRIERSGRPL